MFSSGVKFVMTREKCESRPYIYTMFGAGEHSSVGQRSIRIIIAPQTLLIRLATHWMIQGHCLPTALLDCDTSIIFHSLVSASRQTFPRDIIVLITRTGVKSVRNRSNKPNSTRPSHIRTFLVPSFNRNATLERKQIHVLLVFCVCSSKTRGQCV